MPDANQVMIYEIRYQGNKGSPLAADPCFRKRADAKAFAKSIEGCGLRYGAFVKGRRVTAEHAAKVLREA